MATKFVLIGSGPAGGLFAAHLGRRGYEVELSERRAGPREELTSHFALAFKRHSSLSKSLSVRPLLQKRPSGRCSFGHDEW